MKWEKGQVQKLMGSRLVQVRLNSGAEITRHLDQLRFDESSHTGAEIDDDDGIEITGIQDNEDPTTEPVLGPPTLIDSNEQEMEDGEHQGIHPVGILLGNAGPQLVPGLLVTALTSCEEHI